MIKEYNNALEKEGYGIEFKENEEGIYKKVVEFMSNRKFDR